MALKIWQIKAANERIEQLETELAALTKERDELQAAIESNQTDVSTAAETLQTQLTAERETSATLASGLKKAQADLEAKALEIATLTKNLAAKDQEVEVKVSRQLQETQAAIGQTGAPSIPDDKKTESKSAPKTGFAKAVADIAEQISKVK